MVENRIWCFAPWYNIHFHTISNTISVAPCCFYGPYFLILKSMPKTEEQVTQIYNSNEFIELRKRLLTGRVSGTPCEYCYERLLNDVRWGISPQMGKEVPKFSFNSSRKYISFHAHANDNYQTGEIVLKHPPLSYYFFLSHQCNLRCIMCSQNHNDSSSVPIASVIELLSNQGFDKIDQIGLIGGEPFFSKDGLELVHYLANKELFGANVYITTNGTRLKYEIQSLLSLKNLKLTISVDGGDKQTYEFIRRGESWEDIVENLRILTRKDIYNPDWEILINCCVMKSNICHLDKLIDLAHDLGFNIVFSAISGVELKTENIILYSYLLDDLDWEICFKNALEKAKSFGMDKTTVYLKLLFKLLTSPLKITRKMMIDFWEYGWKSNKDIAYDQLGKIYLAKLNVNNQLMDIQSIEKLMFPGKWRVMLLIRLQILKRTLVRTFPIVKKIKTIVIRITSFWRG